MTAATTNDELVRNMVVMGLGLGTAIATFTIIVQNAFPYERLGVVTSSLAFFRSIGGAVGTPLLGSIMNNRFLDEYHAGLRDLPAPLQQQLAGYSPAALMNATNEQLEAQFAPFGQAGAALAHQVEAIRAQAFASRISEVFFIGTLLLGVAFVMGWFLKEIPLRRSHGAAARTRGRLTKSGRRHFEIVNAGKPIVPLRGLLSQRPGARASG